jgi:hypothetical protein
MFPHDAIRTNTIFEVVKAAGGVTAWADKHPAYDLVNVLPGREWMISTHRKLPTSEGSITP